MKPIKMTYEIAMAVGRDEANRLKISKGLRAWDEECFQAAVDAFNRLYNKHDPYPRNSHSTGLHRAKLAAALLYCRN